MFNSKNKMVINNSLPKIMKIYSRHFSVSDVYVSVINMNLTRENKLLVTYL